MGLIKKIAELFSAKRYIQKVMEEYDREQARYAAMTKAELAALSDADLLSAAVYRAERRMTEELGEDREGTPADWVRVLPHAAATVYMLSEFEAEMLLGDGLAEFFEDVNRGFAPFVAGALAEIGAEEHRALYESFLDREHVDTAHTESFPSYLTAKAIAVFNEGYRALPVLESTLAGYIRANLAEF